MLVIPEAIAHLSLVEYKVDLLITPALFLSVFTCCDSCTHQELPCSLYLTSEPRCRAVISFRDCVLGNRSKVGQHEESPVAAKRF